MKEILVGYTGFVGSNINLNHKFDLVCNSKNIKEAYNTNPDLLIYSGVPAQKFIANKNPEEDLNIIKNAILNIEKINPKKLILISTIDVFSKTKDITEDSKDYFETEQAYGKNRRYLEEWVINNIDDYLIVRLPGLYGKNIKKNFIYDLINYIPSLLKKSKLQELSNKDKNILNYYEEDKNDFYKVKHLNSEEKENLINILKNVGFSALNFTDSRGSFQFYNLSYLWNHIELALENNIKILHLATEPITINELYKYLYKNEFKNEITENIHNYNFKTKYYDLINGKNGYIFDKKFILQDIKKFIKEEQTPKINFAISNIAWDNTIDEEIYNLLYKLGINGLEIAPTRIISDKPYEKENIKKAQKIFTEIKSKYNLQIVSMQSIWFGHCENIFENDYSYNILKEYTYQAILYAEAIGCKNLVFGCPKNRNMTNKNEQLKIAIKFFNEIGDYALKHNVFIALEPNPPIYNTNFINKTTEAINFIKQLSTTGVKINFDLGTVIEKKEDINILKNNIKYINHIHISEPNLNKIENRKIHSELFKLLKELKYDKYVSIEMKKQEKIEDIKEVLDYLLQTAERS